MLKKMGWMVIGITLCLCTSAVAAANYKIGVVTPTLSASEDEFRGGDKMVNKYPGMIKHITLPENFSTEQETAITQIVSLADDRKMKPS